MNIDEFWQLIDKTGTATNYDMHAQTKMLEVELAKLSLDDIQDFRDIQFQLEIYLRNHHQDVWDAAYIIGGGCSDDGFAYFTCWLIAQGKAAFDNTLQDPQFLADYITIDGFEDFQYEPLCQVAYNAYRKKAKRDWEWSWDKRRVSLELVNPQKKASCIDETGDYEECLEKRYPKLWEKFG